MPALPAHTPETDRPSDLSARASRRASRFGIAAIAALIFLFAASQLSFAHGRRASGGPAAGIEIPNLTHGQMAVIADHRSEILRLAAARGPTRDIGFRRVLNYANIQFTYCMWGLVPASISDEESPFNECSHAYLAATRAVLLDMRDGRDGDAALAALLSRIDMEMVRNNASLVLCRYSGESFNTADVIRPDWAGVPFHPPSIAAFAGFSVLLAGGLFAAMRTAGSSRPRDR